MKIKYTMILLGGLTLAAGMGQVSADETTVPANGPMTLSATQMDDVTAGWHYYYGWYNANADALAFANAYGPFAASFSVTNTVSAPGHASSSSASSSSTGCGGCYY